MFWAESGVVRTATLDGGEVVTLVVGGFPTSTAIDTGSGVLYWTDNETDTVNRTELGGSTVTLYRSPSSVSNPRGLAIDTHAARMFWAEDSVVKTAALDGTGAATFVTGAFPTSVALDAAASLVYWTDNGTDTVNAVAYDGSQSRVVYQSADPFSNPDGLALDAVHSTLFWVEFPSSPSSAGRVMSADTHGGSVATVLSAKVPTSVAVDPGAEQIYWSDNGTDQIHRSTYDGGADELLYANPDAFSNPRGLSIDLTNP